MKRRMLLPIFMVIMIVLSVIMYSIDKKRTLEFNDPLFSIREVKDGDTTKYTCFFYSVEKIEFAEIFPLEWDPNENYESFQNEDQYTIYFWFEKWFE